MSRTGTASSEATRSVPKQPTRARRSGGRVPELTPAERAERGKAARGQAPRSSHAQFDPPASRPDPVDLLETQAAQRVPELVPIRYGRMISSAFAFYRGATLIMASDLYHTPRTGLMTQLCGDAHLLNFGLFGTPERRLIFDINDFDETLKGPWEWDVKRLAASITVSARENAYSTKQCRAVTQATVTRYREAMRKFATMPNLDVWYASADVEEVQKTAALHADQAVRRRMAKSAAKARTHDSMQELEKLCDRDRLGGEPRIVGDPPLIVPIADLLPSLEHKEMHRRLEGLVRQYRRSLRSDRRHLLEQFRIVDVARKVVGVGSVGTRCWMILFLGRDEDDPLFLQAKEAPPSVLANYAGQSEYANDGHRVVAGQRLMQAASDIFLGWQRSSGIDGTQRDFYLRQLRDWKWSAKVDTMTPSQLGWYGQLCGWTLARAHARSGDRIGIASYLGSSDRFDRAVTEFAEAYADQNAHDHDALSRAVEAGRVSAERDV